MHAAAFNYVRPSSLVDALAAVGSHQDAKILAGGPSLVAAMKLRLPQPKTIIDIGHIRELSYIREQDGKIALGAMTTHSDIEASSLLRDKCPLLTELAPQIGDVQVRNKGTIGGSLVHADPSADWPACILALDDELVLAGPDGGRAVDATDVFVDMLQTTVIPNSILSEIPVP